MKKLMMALAAAAVLAMTSGSAFAHGTPCCAVKPCKAWDAEGNCITPNAGKACISSLPTNAQAVPGRQAIAGCVDGEDGVCIGGRITPAGPSGCAGAGPGGYVVGSSQGATPEQCTNAAVDQCCLANACQ